MKFYCKKCGTILTINEDAAERMKLFDDGMHCPFNLKHGEVEMVPNYETPAQYQERTGEAYPDKGLVWQRHSLLGKWFGKTYLRAREDAISNHHYCDIVIADPPLPPSKKWRAQ